MHIKDLEKKREALLADRTVLQTKIDSAKARVETIQDELASLDSELGQAGLTDPEYYQNKAVIIAGLKLEEVSLETFMVSLQDDIKPMSSLLEGIGWNISDIKKEENNEKLKAEIKELKSQGKSNKTIRSDLRLSEREYERLAA